MSFAHWWDQIPGPVKALLIGGAVVGTGAAAAPLLGAGGTAAASAGTVGAGAGGMSGAALSLAPTVPTSVAGGGAAAAAGGGMPWWAKYAGMHGLNAALGMLSRPQPQPAPPPDMAPQQPQAPEAQQTFYGQPDIAAMYRQIAGPSYGGGYF